MPTRYAKTEAGQREIRERGLTLTRPARTLLVLADGQRDAEQLLRMVQGSTAQDLQALLDAGLLRESSGAAAAPPGPPAAVSPPAVPATPAAASAPATPAAPEPVPGLGYRELYDSLTALVKEQLGLLKGYKFALEIERAADVDELRVVAQRFVVEVEKAKGEASAQMARRALGLAR